MAHEVETMAYANSVPWHGLGVNIDADKPVDHWLHMAGLDWEVEFQPLHIYKGEGDYTEIKTHRALVRTTDQRVLTVTGDRWQPTQNRDAFEFFKEFTVAGGARMETAGSLQGGRIVWGLASLEDRFTVAGRSDIVKGYLLLVSPHLLGRSILAKVTGVRVVCANTLAMATKGTGAIEKRFSHVRKFDAKVAADAIGLVREEFSKFGKLANQLAKLRLSDTEVLGILQPIVDPTSEVEGTDPGYEPNRSLEAILDSYRTAPGATPGTGWGLINGVTHWADHTASAQSADKRLESAWISTNASRKMQVLRVLEEMV